jgi:stage III sporulation protein AH
MLKDAQAQKLAISEAMEKEVTIEGLLEAKGFDNAVVTLHDGSVNVIVNSAELTSAQVAQILDIVQRESGEKSENIKIVPKG